MKRRKVEILLRVEYFLHSPGTATQTERLEALVNWIDHEIQRASRHQRKGRGA